MDDYSMEPDLTIGSITIRSILSNKDLLSHPMKATCTDKDKDYNDVYADASAAFLGPNIWDKNLTEFKMDDLDLDALLGGSEGHHALQGHQAQANQAQAPQGHQAHAPQGPPVPQGHQGPQKAIDCNEINYNGKVPNHHQHLHHHHHHHHQEQVPVPAQDAHNLVPVVQSSRHVHSQPSSPDDSSILHDLSKEGDNSLYAVDCKFSPSDLALATPPGQDHYDPASTSIPDEELKPQPIIKKSRKNFVPDNLKDDKYWARRHKNNIAAKRSREARRLKENQIVLRASYLEKENNSLKEDVMRLKAENDMLKKQLNEFQS